jgi:hypothetical protein
MTSKLKVKEMERQKETKTERQENRKTERRKDRKTETKQKMIYFGVLQKSGFVSRRLNLKLYFDNVMCVCFCVRPFVCEGE